jgi:histidinol dehydrogenase
MNSLHKQVKSDFEDVHGAEIDTLRREDNSYGLYVLLREFVTGTAQKSKQTLRTKFETIRQRCNETGTSAIGRFQEALDQYKNSGGELSEADVIHQLRNCLMRNVYDHLARNMSAIARSQRKDANTVALNGTRLSFVTRNALTTLRRIKQEQDLLHSKETGTNCQTTLVKSMLQLYITTS